jgi:hypothetical protein
LTLCDEANVGAILSLKRRFNSLERPLHGRLYSGKLELGWYKFAIGGIDRRCDLNLLDWQNLRIGS